MNQPADPSTQSKTRRAAPLLLWTLLGSLALHATPMLTMLSLEFRDGEDADLEWFGEMEELRSLGHGEQGRWAKVQTYAIPKEPAPPEPAPPEIESTPEVEPTPPKPDPTPPKPKPKKVATLKKKPKPKPTPKPKPVVSAQKKRAKAPIKKSEPVTPESKPSPTPSVPAGLPGMELAGPSKLPSFEHYAPGNARFMAMLRMDRLRGTKLAAGARQVLNVVPDYRIILDGQDVDPVKEFDTIFMASANPQRLRGTFLAVRHNMGTTRIKQVLGSRFEPAPAWIKYKGYDVRPLVPQYSGYKDPRRIMLATKNLALITRPEWMGQLTSKPKGDAAVEGALPMIQGLNKIEEAAITPKTIVMVSAQGLTLPGMSKLPRFQTARLLVENPSRPKVTIDLKFKDANTASAFTCSGLKRGVKGLIPGGSFILGPYVNRLKCTQKEDYVTVVGSYRQDEILTVMGLVMPFIRGPRALDKLPSSPQALAAQKAKENPAPQDATEPTPESTTPGATAPDNKAPETTAPAAQATTPADPAKQAKSDPKPAVLKQKSSPFRLFGTKLPSQAEIEKAKLKAKRDKKNEQKTPALKRPSTPLDKQPSKPLTPPKEAEKTTKP